MTDCYSERERPFLERWQRVRDRALGPLFKWLAAHGVTATMLTCASLALGVGGAVVLSLGHYWLALALIALHLALDGLDGPMARHTDSVSASGAWFDAMTDQVVASCTLLALWSLGLGSWLVLLIIAGYTLSTMMALELNRMGRRILWMIRPRLVVYALLPVFFWLWSDLFATLEPILVACTLPQGLWLLWRRIRDE